MPKKTDMTPAEIDLIESVGLKIVTLLANTPCEVDGAPMVPVKYKEGNFKNKTLIAGWIFFPAYAHLGARGDLIFGFTPEDAQEYEFAELAMNDVDRVFPLLGATLMPFIQDEFMELKKLMGEFTTGHADGEKLLNMFGDLLDVESFKTNVNTLVAMEGGRRILEIQKSEDTMKADPTYGAF